MPLSLTYRADLEEITVQKLHSLSVEFDTSQDPIYQLNNWYHRAISQQPRSIVESRALSIPTERLNTYNFLKHEIKIGGNLNKFLHKPITKANFSDGFLNDLNLYHFHLGDGYDEKNKGFIARSDYVAIAKVTPTEVIVLCIENHNKKINPNLWYDYKIIEILHCEFPSYLSNLKIDSDSNCIVENIEERKTYRKSKMNCPIRMSDGTTYLLPGLGVDVSGNSLKAKISSFQYVHIFNRISEKIIPLIIKLQLLNNDYNSNKLTVTLLNVDKCSAILRLNYDNKNSILLLDLNKNLLKSIRLESFYITNIKYMFTFEEFVVTSIETDIYGNILLMMFDRNSVNDFNFLLKNPIFEKELNLLININNRFKATVLSDDICIL